MAALPVVGAVLGDAGRVQPRDRSGVAVRWAAAGAGAVVRVDPRLRWAGGVGAALVVVGLLVAAVPMVSARALGVALVAAALLHLLLAAGFVVAFRTVPTASLLGPITYVFVAAWHGLHANHYLRLHRRQ